MANWIDEFVFSGSATYTSEFTPAVVETELGGSGGAGSREYCAPFGDQTSYLEIPYSTLQANGFAIHTGDFTIEGRFHIDTLYELLEGDPIQRYAVVGQYVDYLWAGDVDAAPGSWWALEFTNDTFTFKVWDGASQTYKANVSGAVVMDWAAAWSDPCHDKANLDAGYVHVAVVRSGSTVRIFINGTNVGESTISDWTEITESLKINGQDGRLNPGLPYSVTYVEELITFDYAKYWADFVVGEALFTQGAGICIFPRVFGTLVKGLPGDLSARLGFSPRIHGTMIKGVPGDIYDTNFSFRPRIQGTMTFTPYTVYGQFTLLPLPLFSFLAVGQDNPIGMMNISLPGLQLAGEGDYPPEGDLAGKLPPLRFRATGVINESGSLSITIPALQASLAVRNDIDGTLTIALPSLRADLEGVSSIEGTLSVTIPMLEMLLMNSLGADFQNMVLNLRNSALTEYSNYDFNSLCNFNGVNLGATATHIFNLDLGTKDDDVEIVWNFRTAYLDLDARNLGKIREVWFSYKSDGDIMVTAVTADGSSYEYPLTGMEVTEDGIRVKFGRGLRRQYLAIDVSNLYGSSIVLDSMKLLIEKA